MFQLSPRFLMLLGLLMLLTSFLTIFGMVLRLVEASFLLGFGAYGISFLGLMIGLAGILAQGQTRSD